MTQPQGWFLDEDVHQVGDDAGDQKSERERNDPAQRERNAFRVERFDRGNHEVIDDWYVHQVNAVTERGEATKDRKRERTRDEAVAVQKQRHRAQVHDAGDGSPRENFNELHVLRAEHGRLKQQPEAREGGQGEHRAVQRNVEPLAEDVAIVAMDQRDENAGDERVEAGVRPEIQGAVEDEIVPRTPAVIDAEPRDERRETERTEQHDATAVRLQSLEDKEKNGYEQVKLLFERQRPTPEHDDLGTMERDEVCQVRVLVHEVIALHFGHGKREREDGEHDVIRGKRA